MKPVLVIGLGNPLMGDEGIGCQVADRLAADPRLPPDVEVISGGTDLLRYADLVQGRRRVLLIDAMQDDAVPGSVSVFEEDLTALEQLQEHAHHLSLVQAIEILRAVSHVPITLMGISISSALLGRGISAELKARAPALVERILSLI